MRALAAPHRRLHVPGADRLPQLRTCRHVTHAHATAPATQVAATEVAGETVYARGAAATGPVAHTGLNCAGATTAPDTPCCCGRLLLLLGGQCRCRPCAGVIKFGGKGSKARGEGVGRLHVEEGKELNKKA